MSRPFNSNQPLLLINKFGRKTLMYIGSIGYITSLSAVAYAF